MHGNSYFQPQGRPTSWCTVMANKKEVWDTPDPSKKDKKLTPEQKSEAKARAKKAGRPYPNLVDNMAVSKKGKK